MRLGAGGRERERSVGRVRMGMGMRGIVGKRVVIRIGGLF
jgi:hypothetical protein